MLTIYLVRHGQSRDNFKQIHQGDKTPLSSYGRNQAKRVAKRMRKHKIDKIYASPQKRAKETALAISRSLNKPIEYWGEIKEVSNPSEMVGLSFKTQKSRDIRKTKKEREVDPNWRYSDEENFNDQKKRGLAVLRHIEKEHQGQNILCVSHGTIVKLLLSLLIYGEDLKAKEFYAIRDTIKISNTGLTKCRYFDKDGWKVFSINDVAHL